MSIDESWDAKQQEVWKRIVEAENSLSELKSQLKTVEEIANNKVSENEATTATAAKAAVENVTKISELLKQTESLQSELKTAKQILSEIETCGIKIKEQTELTSTNVKTVTDAKITSEDIIKVITTCKDDANKICSEVNAKFATAKQQAENITALEAKVKQDTDTALTKATDSITKTTELLKKTEPLQANLEKVQITLSQITEREATIKTKADEVIANAKIISDAKLSAENSLKSIVECQTKATQATNDTNAKLTVITQQVQNITNLSAEAKQNAATAQTSRQNIEKLHTEITNLKIDFGKVKETWVKDFSDTKNKHDEQLKKLYDSKEAELKKLIIDHTNILAELNSKYTKEFEERTEEIESLLPGATSAGLAKAFSDRKVAIEKNKKWWAGLLIGSAIALIAFGIFSLTPWGSKLGLASSIAGRTVIIAGLILLEEFARRNFNIISRLAESYAYKEALANSYLGYKKQMEEISMPSKEPKTEIKGHSVLMKTLLEKLEDEPGKHVFDREKQVIGIGATMDKISPNNPDGVAGKAIEELSKGNILTKISWPIVAVVAILAISGCIIAYLLK